MSSKCVGVVLMEPLSERFGAVTAKAVDGICAGVGSFISRGTIVRCDSWDVE